MTLKISDKSLASLNLDGSVMVYGFRHCHYLKIGTAFELIMKRYTINMGDEHIPQYRLSGEKIHQIDSGFNAIPFLHGKANKASKRYMKAALVNLCFDNYLRIQKSQHFTPIIFCIDRENNPHPLTPYNLLHENYITHSEIIRAYNLCCDPELDSAFRLSAEKSFTWVKAHRTRCQCPGEKYMIREYDLEKIPAPWMDPEFSKELMTRPKGFLGKVELQDLIGRAKRGLIS
jgi:hypothetical protein